MSVSQLESKCADARSTEVGIGCFSGDSLVRLIDGREKPIGSLQSGDAIFTAQPSKLSSTEMIFMLDRQTSEDALFYTLVTASGHKISATPLHLIFIVSAYGGKDVYLPAREIQLGDQLFVEINGQVRPSRVLNITLEVKRGYFAPLTTTGTLMVNGILSSCYASVRSHEWAHIFLGPVRWYHALTRSIPILGSSDEQQTEGIPCLVDLIHRWALLLLPSMFQLS